MMPHSTCIISIVRLFTLKSAVVSADSTWDNAPTSWWTVVELNCGIICASGATLRPMLRHIIPGLGQDHTEGYRQQNSTPHVPLSSSAARAKAAAAAAPPGDFADYALRHIESADSSSSPDPWAKESKYETADYARHPGKVNKLTTAIYGGRHPRDSGNNNHNDGNNSAAETPELTPTASQEELAPGGRRVANSQKIRVTKETRVEETRR